MPVAIKDGRVVFQEARERWKASRKHWEYGLEHTQGELGDLARKVDAFLSAERLPEAEDVHVDIAAAAECMLMHSASLVWPIAEHVSPKDAMLMKLQSHRYQSQTKTKQGVGWWWELYSVTTSNLAIEPYNQLRAVMCTAKADAYEIAREEAAKHRTEPWTRALIDFTFPSEPAWANEDLDTALAAKNLQTHERMTAGLLASANDASLAKQFLERASAWVAMPFLCDLVIGFSPDDAWMLLETVFRRLRETGVRNRPFAGPLARAMSALKGEEPARLFAPLLLERGVGPIAAAYFRRWPDLSEAVLPERASHKNITADVANRILYGHRAVHPEKRSTPALLEDPPWHHLPQRPFFADLPPLEHSARVVWAEGERQATLDLANAIPMTPEILAEWEAVAIAQRSVDAFAKWMSGSWKVWEVPAEISLPLWNEKPEMRAHHSHVTMLARHGEAAIPGLIARGQLEAMVHIDSPLVAPSCAHALLRKRMARRMGRAWLLEHPETAAIGLIPNAFGADGRPQREAEIALMFLADRGHRDVLLDVAGRWGKEVHAAMKERLDRDPIAEIEMTDGYGWSARELPRPRLRDGSTLSEHGFENLLDLLRGVSPVVPYRGYERLREIFEPDSLAELARALFEVWLLAPGSEAQNWMVSSLVGIGNSTTTRAFVQWVRERGQRSDSRSDTILRILAAIGAPSTLLEIALMARDAPLAGVQAEAGIVLGEVAEARGLTRLELEDRIVPTLDLDVQPEIDLGSRRFRIVLDDLLVPHAVGDDGKRLAQLPRPSEKDDPVLARAGAERWRDIASSLETIQRLVVPRLERAMVRGHRWSAEDFTRYIAKHPVVSAIARRLVWSTGFITFRIVEDGTLADETDSRIELDPSAQVFIPHAIELTDEGKTLWGQVLADYGILQPFDQLGRVTCELPKGELSGNRSKRVAGRVLNAHKILQLADANGWRRPAPSAMVTQLWRMVRGKKNDLRVWLQVQPGFWLWKIEKDQTLGDVVVIGGTFADIHPLDLSELVRDLDAFM